MATQPSTMKLGKSHKLSDPLTVYVRDHNPENPALARLRHFSVQHQRGMMTSPVEVGKLLTLLANTVGARKVIDVGVFLGCSAFALALGIPDDCKVIACDISEEYTSLGQPYWEEGGVSPKIDLRIQPAESTLQALLDAGEGGTFDLMFIDADKNNYPNYFEFAMKLLRPGGLIVIDNALWGGSVADPSVQDAETGAIRKVNELMKTDPRVESVLLNIADGLAIGRRRS